MSNIENENPKLPLNEGNQENNLQDSAINQANENGDSIVGSTTSEESLLKENEDNLETEKVTDKKQPKVKKKNKMDLLIERIVYLEDCVEILMKNHKESTKDHLSVSDALTSNRININTLVKSKIKKSSESGESEDTGEKTNVMGENITQLNAGLSRK